MAENSLTNFVVSMNRWFQRRKFPFEKSIKLRFYYADLCCLSYFKTLRRSKGLSLRTSGVGDVLWAILVHEPAWLTNRSPGRPVLVGGPFINLRTGGPHYDIAFISP